MKKIIILSIICLPFLGLVLAQLGLLSGKRPKDLGVRDGKLKPPSKNPNSVSSQAHLHSPENYKVSYAKMEPFILKSDRHESFTKLIKIISEFKEARIIEQRPDYIRYEFATPLLKFVDDVEFFLAENSVEFRSASRLGRKDFGKNRNRILEIQKRYLNEP